MFDWLLGSKWGQWGDYDSVRAFFRTGLVVLVISLPTLFLIGKDNWILISILAGVVAGSVAAVASESEGGGPVSF